MLSKEERTAEAKATQAGKGVSNIEQRKILNQIQQQRNDPTKVLAAFLQQAQAKARKERLVEA